MKVTAFSLSLVLLVLVWTEPAAAVAYCPPEYQSCEGAGTPGGTWGGGSSTGGPRDGFKPYGHPYERCAASGGSAASRCWECVWDPNKRTDVCAGVRHTWACGCTEQYSNYIVIDCKTYGYCEYHP